MISGEQVEVQAECSWTLMELALHANLSSEPWWNQRFILDTDVLSHDMELADLQTKAPISSETGTLNLTMAIVQKGNEETLKALQTLLNQNFLTHLAEKGNAEAVKALVTVAEQGDQGEESKALNALQTYFFSNLREGPMVRDRRVWLSAPLLLG